MAEFRVRPGEHGCFELVGEGLEWRVEEARDGLLLDADNSHRTRAVFHVGPPTEEGLRFLAHWFNHLANHVRDGMSIYDECGHDWSPSSPSEEIPPCPRI